MRNDCVTVDELLLVIADYKSNYQEVAAEQLKRLCSQSCEAYSYLQDRAHNDTCATCCYTCGCACTRLRSTGDGIRTRDGVRVVRKGKRRIKKEGQGSEKRFLDSRTQSHTFFPRTVCERRFWITLTELSILAVSVLPNLPSSSPLSTLPKSP